MTGRLPGTLTGPDDVRHGTDNGYRNLGCRCPACRAAHTLELAVMRDDRHGRIDPDDVRHGTRGFYNNWKCRCEPCADASRRYHRTRRAERKAP